MYFLIWFDPSKKSAPPLECDSQTRSYCLKCTIKKIRSTGSNRRRSRWPGNIIVDHQGKECIVISSDCAQKCSPYQTACRSTPTRSLIYQPQSLDSGSLRTSHRWRPSVGNSISVLKSTATPTRFDSQTMPARPLLHKNIACFARYFLEVDMLQPIDRQK